MASNTWLRVEIAIASESVDALSSFLVDLGSRGVEVEDGEAGRATVVAYFEDEGRGDRRLYVLHRYLEELDALGAGGRPRVCGMTRLDGREWRTAWRRYFPALQITDRITVCPPWLAVDPSSGRIVLTITPGMAFGTGLHETTRLCLALVEELVRPGDSVLDVGAGTAILSLAAAGLGAGRVVAVEIDEAAVKNARENIEQNGMEERIGLICGTVGDVPTDAFDLILGNIRCDVLLAMVSELRARLAPEGRVVFSGVLKTEGEAFRVGLAREGLCVLDVRGQGQWLAMVAGVGA